jgi:hypothetical protein
MILVKVSLSENPERHHMVNRFLVKMLIRYLCTKKDFDGELSALVVVVLLSYQSL